MRASVRYLGAWSNWAEMKKEFFGEQPPSVAGFPSDDEVLLAAAWESMYEGACVVYWSRLGKFYEAEFSHCSCNCYSDDVGVFDAPVEITSAYLTLAGPRWFIGDIKGDGAAVAWDMLLERVP